MRRLLLLLVVLVAACGDGDPGEVEDAAPDAPAALEVDFDEPLRPGPVTWKVEVTAQEALRLEFTSGQRADVSLRRDGAVVYRWSRTRMFTQDLGEVTLAADQTITFGLEDELEVDPGDYELEAVVTASGRPDLRTTRQVTVGPMRR